MSSQKSEEKASSALGRLLSVRDPIMDSDIPQAGSLGPASRLNTFVVFHALSKTFLFFFIKFCETPDSTCFSPRVMGGNSPHRNRLA